MVLSGPRRRTTSSSPGSDPGVRLHRGSCRSRRSRRPALRRGRHAQRPQGQSDRTVLEGPGCSRPGAGGHAPHLERAYTEVSTRLEDPREQSQAATVRSTIAYIEGRYQVAAELSDEALEQDARAGTSTELIHYAQGLCGRSIWAWRRGAAPARGVDRVPGHRQLRRGHGALRSARRRPSTGRNTSGSSDRNRVRGGAPRRGLPRTHGLSLPRGRPDR